LAAVLLSVVLFAWFLHRVQRNTFSIPASQLTIGTVTRGVFEDYIPLRSTVAPLTTYYLTTEQGGIVKQVLAADGSSVKAGDPLIVLSNAALQLEVTSRAAATAAQINALENTRLQLEQTRFQYERDLLDIDHQIEVLKGNLERDKILLDGHAISPRTYAQEQSQYDYELKLREATLASRDAGQSVRSRQFALLGQTLDSLKASDKLAVSSLDALTIRAPVNGQFTNVSARNGESAAAGSVLGQVEAGDGFKLNAQVDEFYLRRLALGQLARFDISGEPFQATVSRIYPQVKDGTFKIELTFGDRTPPSIAVGQAIDVRLSVGGSRPALLIPNGPFYQSTSGRWVFVLSPDGREATRRTVDLGRKNPDAVEVLQGLYLGEKVVTSGYDGFQDIDRLTIPEDKK
jgi:HlyD family secretion protein